MALLAGLTGIVGYGVLQSLSGPRRDASPPQDPVELILLLVMTGCLVVGWVGVTLLQLGWFSPARTLCIALVLAASAASLGWHCYGMWRPAVSASRYTWLLIGTIGLGAALFMHPAEFVLGGGDAGVYVNLGSAWAETGSFTLTEDGLAELSAELRPGLFRAPQEGHVAEAVRLPGFYLMDSERGVVTPQFFPLHPMWMALVNGCAGTALSLYATPIWATLGLACVVAAARTMFGYRVGLLSGVLLVFVPLQIYFARYPTAESLTQALIWFGLYGLARFDDEGGRHWGIVAGLAIGQVFLARIDALPVLIVPFLRAVYCARRAQWRHELWFLVPFLVLFLQAVYQSLVLSWPYTWEIYGSLIRYGLRMLQQYWPLVAVLCAMGLFAFYLAAFRSVHVLSVAGTYWRWVVAFLVVIISVYGYFVWPVTGEMKLSPYWYGDTSIPVTNHLNMVKLGWYMTPLGIWVAVLGVAWMIGTEPWNRIWQMLCIGLSFTVLYVHNIMNNPYHIYAMRRYVPAVVPFLTVGIAYGIVRLWSLRVRWRATGWLAFLCVLTLIPWLCFQGRAIWTLSEYSGLYSQIRAIAHRLDPHAVLLFDDAPPVGVGATVGTPLQYGYGFTSFDLQEADLSAAALENAVADWTSQGRPVYWVVGPEPVLRPPEALSPRPAFGVWLDTTVMERSYFDFPDEKLAYRVPLEFYSLASHGTGDACTLPYHIDIGLLDSLEAASGFYDKELLGVRTVRWTNGDGLVVPACLPSELTSTATVEITLATSRSTTLESSGVQVWVGAETFGGFALGDGFQTVAFSVPVAELKAKGVRIVSDTWVPKEHGVGNDVRSLGVLVDSVTIAESGDDN